MKNLKILFAILLIAISITSCSDNEDNPDPIKYAEENPLDAYMVGSGYNQKSVDKQNAGTFEFGFKFKPTVEGKINAFIVKIPDINHSLRVTLWDIATKTPIKSEILNVTIANVTVEKTITAISLAKNKEYYITVKSNDYISRMRADYSDATYPISAGNITVTGCAVSPSDPTDATEFAFPTNAANNYYPGDVTFKFQQTE